MNTIQDITIRRFENSDANDVSQLITENLILINGHDYGEEAVRELARFYSPQLVQEYAQYGDVYVAVENSTIIGTAALEQDRVRNVFVKIAHHQQGIGKLLMQSIGDLAHQQGKARLVLKASISAVMFYQKLGYVAVQEREERIGNVVIKVIVMEKMLPVVPYREKSG
jgi:N-acetylglutamate synthase-like GNAT family acetyltransferase